jgi:hypothetical protein
MFLYLNVGAILGIVASLFILPGKLRFAHWLCGAIVILATVNVLAFWRLRNSKRSDDATRRLKTSSKVIIYAGLLFFLLDMVLSYIFRH